MKSLKETMRENLRFYLQQSGLSQKQFADAVGVSQPTVFDWVQGNKTPRIEKYDIICSVLGITIQDLFADANKAKPIVLSPEQKNLLSLFDQLSTADKQVYTDMLQTFLMSRGYYKRKNRHEEG